jgi:hypothetical protein
MEFAKRGPKFARIGEVDILAIDASHSVDPVSFVA